MEYFRTKSFGKMMLNILIVGWWSGAVVSCGDSDSDGDGDGDSNGDSDGDTAVDTDSETESVGECGDESAVCCEGNTCNDDGLDPVVSPLDQSCMCQAPCTFEACEAGSESGYCTMVYGTEILGCYNSIDLPLTAELADNDCTEGEQDCTSDSGATTGTECISTPNPMTGTPVLRCVVICSEGPTGCDETTSSCTPNFAIEGTNVSLDFEDSHCAPMTE